MSSKSLLVLHQTRNVPPPQARIVPQRKQRARYHWSVVQGLRPQNNGHQPSIRGQEPFFRKFRDEDLSFLVFTPEFVEFRHISG